MAFDIDPVPVAPSNVYYADRISNCGITWYFDRQYEVGGFVNGDPWVIGPVNIVGISPGPSTYTLGSNTYDVNGSEVNPDLWSEQGFDAYAGVEGSPHQPGHIQYDPTLNVARSIPFTVSGSTDGDSLVSVESYPGLVGRTSKDVRIKKAGVLTVYLSGTTWTGGAIYPPADLFRPPYVKVFGNDYTYQQSGMVNSNSQRLGLYTGNLADGPDLGKLADSYRCIRLEPCVADRSVGALGIPVTDRHKLMNDYQTYSQGRDIAVAAGQAALVYHSSGVYSTSSGDFQDMRRGIMQRAIDNLGMYDWVNDNWPGAFHKPWEAKEGLYNGAGRKFELLFGSYLMSGDANLLAAGSDNFFHEYQQVFSIDWSTVFQGQNYTSGMTGTPEWGIKHGARAPYLDNANWESPDTFRNERADNSANAWWGQVLACQACGFDQPGGGWESGSLSGAAIYDYMHRYATLAATNNAKAWQLAWDQWSKDLYDTYDGTF